MSGARSSLRLRDHGAGSPVAEQVTRGRAQLEEPARRRVRLSEELQQGPCFALSLLPWSSSRRQTSRLRRATGTQELRPAPSLLRQAAGDRSPQQEHEQELAATMGVRGSSVNCRIRLPSAPCVHRLFFIRSGEELPLVPVASSRRSLARPQ